MAMSSAVGLDIASDGVRLLAVEANGSELRVTAAREQRCATEDNDALTQGLSQLRHAAGLSRPVVLGLPSAAAILTTVTPLLVHSGRAELAVAFELQQQLPFALADTAWHYRWLRALAPDRAGTASAGRREANEAVTGPREAVAVAMRRSLLEDRLAACRRASIEVAAVLPSPLAVYNTWRLRTGGRGGAVILRWVHDRLAEWIVATDTRWEVAAVSDQEPGDPGWSAAHIAASWDALRAHCPDMPPAVWLLAPPQAAEAWRAALSARGAGPVELLDPLRAVKLPAGARLDAPERWASAIGLAAQAAGAAGAPVNLLAQEQHRRQERRITRAASWASAACLVLALGFAGQGMLEAYRRQLAILRALEQQERAYQALRPEVRAMLQHQQDTERRIARLTRLAQGAAEVPQLVATAAQALPPRVWMDKIELGRDDRTQATIEGRARTFQELTEFMDRLKVSGSIAAVRPLSTDVVPDPETGKESVGFSIQVQMAPEPLPPPPADPAKDAP